jgi:hypothetical protein
MGNRIFYACQNVELAGPSGQTGSKNPAYDQIQGLQSIGMNTNFNLEPIYQLGQLDLYDNFEEMPEVEISLNKVLDGGATIFEMTMGTGHITQIANNRSSLKLSLYPDSGVAYTGSNAGAPVSQVLCEPVYLSQVTYTFPTEGNFTEEATLVSNNKVWLTGTNVVAPAAALLNAPKYTIMRRGQMKKWGEGTILPSGASGGLPAGSKINSITVSMNFGREQLRELGRRTPYLRYVNFPLEITTEIEVMAREVGDTVSAIETSLVCENPKSLAPKEIVVCLCDGMTLNMGTNNKLTSVNFQGGDTGGGNATLTYSYQTFNNFTYTAPTSGYPAFSDVIEAGLPTQGDFF